MHLNILAEEQLIFIIVLISIPALVYAVERITNRKVYNRLIVLLLLVMVTWYYMDKVEVYYRNKIYHGEETLIQEADYPEEPGPVMNMIYRIFDRINPPDKPQ